MNNLEMNVALENLSLKEKASILRDLVESPKTSERFNPSALTFWASTTSLLSNDFLKLPGITRAEIDFFDICVSTIITIIQKATIDLAYDTLGATLTISNTLYSLIEIRRKFDPNFLI